MPHRRASSSTVGGVVLAATAFSSTMARSTAWMRCTPSVAGPGTSAVLATGPDIERSITTIGAPSLPPPPRPSPAGAPSPTPAGMHDGRMPLFEFEGRLPEVSPAAWIAPTATLVGDVRVEAEASIWFRAVLRADFGPIIVRRGANIQDGSVLHGGSDPVTDIGEGA